MPLPIPHRPTIRDLLELPTLFRPLFRSLQQLPAQLKSPVQQSQVLPRSLRLDLLARSPHPPLEGGGIGGVDQTRHLLQ